jgi:hypothetical protein
MDTKQFIASLVSSLAWPTAVFGIALLFRKQLTDLLTGPLRRLKAGPGGVELEFERILPKVQAQVEAPKPDEREKRLSEPSSDELAEVAQRSPAAAVLGAYARLEAELRTRLAKAGDERADKLAGQRLVHAALERGLISEQTAEGIEGVMLLRNLSAHGREGDLSVERALDYITLVDALLYAIRQNEKGRP